MADTSFSRIGVVGGGAWGTALAHSLCISGHDVRLWAYEAETIREIQDHKTNRAYLPGVELHKSLKATGKLDDLSDSGLLLLVPPAQHLRRIASQLQGINSTSLPVLICAKGIEQSTGKMLGDVLREEMPKASVGVLSGPSFAAEVARGLPAAVTVACAEESLGKQLAKTLGSKRLRIYWSNDLKGVQLGGAIKNVLAIAAGIVDGKELGANAHAALVTRGFAEMRRIGAAIGARAETLSGLSGLGDLLLTCGSVQSRNMSLGRALGEGQSLDEILGERKAITEGVYTAQAIVEISARHGIEVPISASVKGIVEDRLTVDEAIDGLMARPLRSEIEN